MHQRLIEELWFFPRLWFLCWFPACRLNGGEAGPNLMRFRGRKEGEAK